MQQEKITIYGSNEMKRGIFEEVKSEIYRTINANSNIERRISAVSIETAFCFFNPRNNSKLKLKRHKIVLDYTSTCYLYAQQSRDQ